MKQDELIIALQLAIEQFGTSILDDIKLINVLLDLGAFKNAPYAKSVIRELIIEGYMQKIMQVGHDENRIKTLVPMITSQSGFTLQIVEYIVNCLLYVLGYIGFKPIYTPRNIPTHKHTSTIVKDILKGEYKEKLPTGGEIRITADSWNIWYYFPGPDARYNGTFKTIYHYEIDNYISAWRNNFKKYQELKSIIPSDGNSDYPGEKGMSIRFGFSEGVCLTSYHMPIRNETELNSVIRDYETAKSMASYVQQILKGSTNNK